MQFHSIVKVECVGLWGCLVRVWTAWVTSEYQQSTSRSPCKWQCDWPEMDKLFERLSGMRPQAVERQLDVSNL